MPGFVSEGNVRSFPVRESDGMSGLISQSSGKHLKLIIRWKWIFSIIIKIRKDLCRSQSSSSGLWIQCFTRRQLYIYIYNWNIYITIFFCISFQFWFLFSKKESLKKLFKFFEYCDKIEKYFQNWKLIELRVKKQTRDETKL